jgi:Secretion system C-terminal sorting domain/Cohesin domain
MRKVTVPFLKTLVIVFGVLLLATNVALAQVPVSLPNMVGRAGTDKTINVTVGTLPRALSVLSYQFSLSYDTTVIQITGYSADTSTLAYKATMPPVVELTPGLVRVAAASDSVLIGSGTLIKFTAHMVAPGTTALTLIDFRFNEGIPSASPITQGQVMVPEFSVNLPPSEIAEVKQDSTFLIPITADAITGRGILSYQFAVSYDTSKLTITGVSVEGTSSAPIGGNIMINTAVAGRISVAAACPDTVALSGADGAVLLNLQAKVKPTATGVSALTFLSFQFNEGTPTVGGVDGQVYVHDITAIRVIDRVPTKYVLDQNYPNPFNPTTMIKFELAEPAIVTLKVFNTLGQEVATLLNNASLAAGANEAQFDANSMPSGVYFYRLTANSIGDPAAGTAGTSFVSVRKMMLMK